MVELTFPAQPGTANAPYEVRLDALTHSYGSARALEPLTYTIGSGHVCAVLGPNGAGKSTLAGLISGSIPTRAESILFDGEPVGALSAHARAHRGIACIPEGGGIFPSLTVAENLQIGNRSGKSTSQLVAQAADLFPFIAKRSRTHAGMLSGGEQQMLALASALNTANRLIVIDELSHGLAVAVISKLFDVLREWRGQSTVVLIEQYTQHSYALADDVLVLSHGSTAYAGPASGIDVPAIERLYYSDGGSAARP